MKRNGGPDRAFWFLLLGFFGWMLFVCVLGIYAMWPNSNPLEQLP